MDTPRSERVNQLLNEIKENRAKIDKLHKELACSIRVKEIWPEAFAENCTCSPRLEGTTWPNSSTIPYGTKRYPHPYDLVRTINRTYLHRSDGVEFDVSHSDFFSIFETIGVPK